MQGGAVDMGACVWGGRDVALMGIKAAARCATYKLGPAGSISAPQAHP